VGSALRSWLSFLLGTAQLVGISPEHTSEKGFHGFCFTRCRGGDMEDGRQEARCSVRWRLARRLSYDKLRPMAQFFYDRQI
jgi:hypothetical protein